MVSLGFWSGLSPSEMGLLLWMRTLKLREEQSFVQVHRAMQRRARAQSQAIPHGAPSSLGLSVSPDWAGPGREQFALYQQ